MVQSIQLYICYADEDRKALSRLEKKLVPLKTSGKIDFWHRGKLAPGSSIDQHIATHLNQAQIIIVLISESVFPPAFHDSYEMRRISQFYQEQNVRLIPIIVKPCSWEDLFLADLEPLPRGGKPAGTDDRAWASVAAEINEIAIQMQAEQAVKESATAAISPKPRAKSRESRTSRKSASSKAQPVSGAALTIKPPVRTRRSPRSKPPAAPAQPALPEQNTLPAVREPEPVSDAAKTMTPAYSQDYDHTQNGINQIVFAILIWEPSRSTHTLIADERRAIYRALLDERHQCTLGSSLPVPEGQSLQDCEIRQAHTSDMTVLLVEPEIAPLGEWQDFYHMYNDKLIERIYFWYPEIIKSDPESWNTDTTLFWRKRLYYYKEAEITNCYVRTDVLKWIQGERITKYRQGCKGRSGR